MMEYNKPSVEIITFVSRQPLATSEDVDNNELPLDGTFTPGVESAVEPWT